jgi:2-dehydropantoate 2-reductase
MDSGRNYSVEPGSNASVKKNTANNVYIVGAGAIGKTLAAALAASERKVQLIRGSTDDGNSYEKHISVQGSEQHFDANVVVSSSINHPVIDGVVVFANKSYGNEALAEAFASRLRKLPIVIMQNGLGVEDAFLRRGYEQVYRCVLFATSQNNHDDTITFKPVAHSAIGAIKGSINQLTAVVNLLHTSFFPFRSETNIQPIIWKKAIANCVFNSVCPVLETDNGIFHRNDHAWRIAQRIINECVAIAVEKGISLSSEEVEASLLQISKRSEGQIISTLQDIRNKRPTEIDTLNFEICRIAGELGKEHAVTATRLMGELVKLKETLNAS